MLHAKFHDHCLYINFVELEYIMLHAKFHDHRTISSVGDFEGFYHIWA